MIDQEIFPTTIQGKVGDNIVLACKAPLPHESVNNILTVYRPEKDAFRFLRNLPEAEGRLTRCDSGVFISYTFGPLKSSDNGTTLSCLFLGSQSANATIHIIRKSVHNNNTSVLHFL